MSRSDLEVRRRKQLDQDDIGQAIAELILTRRAMGYKINVFPKFFYCNTRVWEDEVGPEVHQQLTEMQIQVRTHRDMPRDKFALTFEDVPARDVALLHKGGGNMGMLN